MKFYKENGVNPLAGCLPMIPQMIIFFSLFYVLRAIAEWKPGQAPKYGLTVPVLESAQKATIFGVHLYDKLLLPHTPGMGVGALDRGRDHRGAQRDDDVHDRPAELQARSHADQRGPGQPDGPVAEVHDVHRPVLLADGFVLAVRAGAVLGDDEPVDTRPAVVHVPELDRRACAGGRRDRRRHRSQRLRPPRPPRAPRKRASGTAKAARAPRRPPRPARGPRQATGGLRRVRRGPRRGRAGPAGTTTAGGPGPDGVGLSRCCR